MYNPALVQPMREELTSIGVRELRTPEEVDETMKLTGSILVVVNSVCGCAAGGARPGVALALKNSKVPDHLTTVFAGQDKEATDHARSYFHGFPPSSPSVALLKDGHIAFMLQRKDIEGFSAQEIATKLTEAFDKYC
jgi:putative YphP/YqiW family bacilliredoxin